MALPLHLSLVAAGFSLRLARLPPIHALSSETWERVEKLVASTLCRRRLKPAATEKVIHCKGLTKRDEQKVRPRSLKLKADLLKLIALLLTAHCLLLTAHFINPSNNWALPS